MALVLAGCGSGLTPEQEAQRVMREKAVKDSAAQYRRNVYIDSLVNVATGLEGVENTVERQHALDILMREYPELEDRRAAIQKSIDNMELY